MWHALSKEEILNKLNTTVNGLSPDEALERLKKYGYNVIIEEPPAPAWKIFLNQFTNVLIIILLIAALVSAAMGDIKNFLAIFAIVILNGILGFIQEYKAEKAIEALKAVFPYKARVVRGGQQEEIEAKHVVPGDIIMVETGDRIPADAYLISSNNLQTQEAVLTGESLPSDKAPGVLAETAPLAEQPNMIFSGTIVTGGSGTAIALATGMQTQFGKIANLTQKTQKEKSPLVKRTESLARQLGVIILVTAFIVVLIGYFQHRHFLEIFMTGVALAVAVIPEGLPIVVTLTLALGVQRMLKKNCLIRRLTASETIGSASIICTDKTGTLTKNEMTLTEIYLPGGAEIKITGAGYDPEGKFFNKEGKEYTLEDANLMNFLKTGLLCNRSELVFKDKQWNVLGDPTEGALTVAAKKAGLDKNKILEKLEFMREFSFTSERKMMSAVYKGATEYFVFTKGAPEVILPLCAGYYDDNCKGVLSRCRIILSGFGIPAEASEQYAPTLSNQNREFLEIVYRKMAQDGLRVLALGAKKASVYDLKDQAKVEQGFTFLGFAGIFDPPRDEAAAALKTATDAGIRVCIITGDNLLTARAVADKLGLEAARAHMSDDLDKLSEEKIMDILNEPFSIFARATPEHKLKITQILQKNNQVVAMTGDGINDAPALKKADVGIAMGIKGTDVAKYASDMVLMDDNFASIVKGNKEGRRQYDNIKKFTQYLLSCNLGEVIAIGGSIMLNLPLILLPIQILWMNLITDGAGSLTLGLEKAEPDIMKRRPRKFDDPIINSKSLIALFLIGVYEGIAILILFKYALNHYPLIYARTLAFTGLILIQLINIFNFRSFRYPLYKIGFFGNMWLIAAFIINILLQAAVVYAPFLQNWVYTAGITMTDWLLLFAISLPLLICGESFKIFLKK